MSKTVFISHSSKDEDRVNDILKELEDSGIKCWIAPRNLLGGMPYAEEIVEGIKNCKVMLLVMSHNALASEHILNEIETAVNCSKIILPFKIDPVTYTDSYKYYLGRKHWIDASKNPQDYYAELIASLDYLLNKEKDDPNTENDSELLAIHERNVNKAKLINETMDERHSFALSLNSDEFPDKSHFYKSIKRIDVIDTPNLKYSNYRWIEIQNQGSTPTNHILHLESGDSKVRFSNMNFRAWQIFDDKKEPLYVDSQTTTQPAFKQFVKIYFKNELLPGESTKLFYRLDWPGEPGAYCENLNTSIAFVRYPKGVGKLTFGILDTVPLYGFEIEETTENFKTKDANAFRKDITIEDEQDLKPLHGKIKAAETVYEVPEVQGSAAYRIFYKQRKKTLAEDEVF